MPRINVEDQLFIDGRFIQLCSKHGEEKAIGIMVTAFRLAQTYWVKNRSLIPKSVFNFRESFKDLINVGLAEEHNDGVYVCGSKDQFDWIITNQENGKKGGRPPKPIPEETQSKPIAIPEIIKMEPIEKPQAQAQSQAQINNNILSEKFNLERIYQAYPKKEGKKNGLERLSKIVTSQEVYDQVLVAVNNYAQACKGKDLTYVKMFSSFVSVWTDYLEIQESERDLAVARIEKIQQDALEKHMAELKAQEMANA